MIDPRPWKVMYDGHFHKDYKRKWAAIRWGKILKDSFPKGTKITVVSPLEIIEI